MKRKFKQLWSTTLTISTKLTINQLSPQTVIHKKSWKSRSWFGTSTKMWRSLLILYLNFFFFFKQVCNLFFAPLSYPPLFMVSLIIMLILQISDFKAIMSITLSPLYAKCFFFCKRPVVVNCQ